MDLADHVAGWSKDPRTQVGAVVADGKHRPSLGYNGFPPGIRDLSSRLKDYDMKHKLTLHAESNAIHNSGHPVAGQDLYVTYPPCIRCTVEIIRAKIRSVTCLRGTDEKMEKHGADIELSLSLFAEANIPFSIVEKVED